MENIKSERFFAELAKAYAKNEGAALKAEFVEINAENRLLPTSGLDRKIKKSIASHKFRNYSLKALPLAASLIIAVLIFSNYRDGLSRPAMSPQQPSAPIVSEQPAPAPTPAPPVAAEPTPTPAVTDTDISGRLRHSVELVSAGLPAGYAVTGVDYDNAAAIMEITNALNNRIVLVTEAYHDFDSAGFSIITVQGNPAYGLVKSDYCVLKYEKDEMLYTLTSNYGFGELLEVVENI